MAVHWIGPVPSYVSVTSVMHFDSCNVVFYKDILIKSNNCQQIITLQHTFIKVMIYTNINMLIN